MSATARRDAWWRPRAWSVRMRSVVAVCLAISPLLVAASVAAVLIQQHDLTRSVALIGEEQARSVARDLERDGAGVQRVEGSLGGEETLIQVVGPDGVLDASPQLRVPEPLAPPPPQGGVGRRVVGNLVPQESDRHLVVTVEVAGSRNYVAVARSLETVDEATASTTRLLGVGVPLLVAVLAGTSWLLVGRALAPVERIRRTADEITIAGSGRRVPAVPTHDEVGRLSQTLNEMLERLDVSARAQRQFVADASHELRSPVATLRALMEVSATVPLDQAELRRDVLAETARLERLVVGLLVLARRDAAGPLRPVRDDPVDLADLVAREVARPRRLPVQAGGTDDQVLVRGDPDALGTVVSNLLDNAERHATSTVTAALSLAQDAAVPEHWRGPAPRTPREDRTAGRSAWWAVLTVTDDGAGVPEHERERIFERFVRLDEARTRDAGGAGLGLAISRAIAVDHAGWLACEVGPGGAVFVLVLPTSSSGPVAWTG
ncbi:HAMP domain-containing sensor histidine kinase [Nocardioides sp.]|uniref:sensor histidine kinase n=1 Tax=Nocardioides sp. TaxID=35761 RepID=UPI00321A0AD8